MYQFHKQEVVLIPTSQLKPGMWVSLQCPCKYDFHEIKEIKSIKIKEVNAIPKYSNYINIRIHANEYDTKNVGDISYFIMVVML